MSRLAMVAAVVVLAAPASAGDRREHHDRHTEEVEHQLQQILEGQLVQSAISRIIYLGAEKYAAESLIEALPRLKDRDEIRNVALALSSFAVKSSERTLVAFLGDEDPVVRMAALQGLTRIKADGGSKVLELLRDRNLGLRREAARCLGASGRAPYAKSLLAAAKDEAEPEVRAAILVSIGDLGDRSQARSLEGFLKASSESTRLAAAQALCKLGAPAGYQVVQKLLSSDDRYQRRQAVALLQGTKAKDADKVLRPLLKDGDPYVAAAAGRILYQGGDAAMLQWMVVSAFKADNSAKLAYETELEALRISDEERRKILAKAGVKAPER